MPELVMLTFDDTYGAHAAFNAIRMREDFEPTWIDDIAVVEKHEDGRVRSHTPHGSTAKGAVWGGLIAVLVFWWFPPTWFAGGWIGGAGIGALLAKHMKHALLDPQLLDLVTSRLTDGSSIVLLIAEAPDADQFVHEFERYRPASIVRRPIAEQTLADLRQELSASSDESAPAGDEDPSPA